MSRLDPRAKLDNVLPFRDPNPANAHLPHPYYRSDINDTVAEGVAVDSVTIADYRRNELKSLAAQERAKPIRERRLNLTGDEVDLAVIRIELAIRAEIERTIAGKKIKNPAHYVRRIGPRSVEPHETALIGQYGLFVRNGIPADQLPTLSNGKIIGLFAGASLKSKPEREAHLAALANGADFHHYSLDIAKSYNAPALTVSPMSAGNSMALANTAILAGTAGTKNPRYDDDRINAIFVACDVIMIGKNGTPRAEQIAAVVGLDNLRGQVYLNYGEPYLSHFSGRSEPSRSSERVANRVRKRDEDDVGDDMTGDPAKRRKLEPRSRSRNLTR